MKTFKRTNQTHTMMEPTNKNLLLLFMSLALVLSTTFIACEGPQGPQGEQGLQGEQGQQGPQGEEGNANASLYIFEGRDFSTGDAHRFIENLSESDVYENAWLIYLVHSNGVAYQVPGWGRLGQSEYRAGQLWDSDESRIEIFISVKSGGEEYEHIHVLRISASDVFEGDDIAGKQQSHVKDVPVGHSHIPDDLDVSDYNAVIEYYGLEP